MQRKISVIAALLAVSLVFTSCGNKTTDDSDVVDITKEQANQMGMIQADDSGNFYTIDENGEKDYIDLDMSQTSDETDGDEEDNIEDEYDKMTMIGEYTGENFKLTTMDNWYIYLPNDDCTLMPSGARDTLNLIKITSFAKAGIENYESVNIEEFNQGYQQAVEAGIYTDFEDLGSSETTFGAYEAIKYEVKLSTDAITVNTTVYFVNDDFGGHIVLCMDTKDDIDVESGISGLMNNITFCDTMSEEKAEDETETITPEETLEEESNE